MLSIGGIITRLGGIGVPVFVVLVWLWLYRDSQKQDEEIGGFSNLLFHTLSSVHFLLSLLLLDTNYA